jgi:GNAT superfamily N-acetyltransferase
VDLPIYRQTKSSVRVELDVMRSEEEDSVRSLLNDIIQEGTSYPQATPLDTAGFTDYWLKGDAFVVRRLEASGDKSLVGAFYIKPNFVGRCAHICNAGFIVVPQMRGKGIGRWMGETMLILARDRGYRAVMYNLVFATNIASLKLWESLGFQTIGRIPAAALLPQGEYVDALLLYKSLVDEPPLDKGLMTAEHQTNLVS